MKSITVDVTVRGPVEKVWEYWTSPEHMKGWVFASDSWECPYAEHDVRPHGRFVTRMSAKDGSDSFDFTGMYTEVEPNASLAYTIDDGRKVTVVFKEVEDGQVHIVETFEMEGEHSEELQRDGWSAILQNFKVYVEKQM